MKSAVLFPGLAPTSFAAIGEFLRSSPAGRRRIADAEAVLGYPLLETFRTAGADHWAVYDCAYLACTLALADHLHERAGDELTGLPAAEHTDRSIGLDGPPALCTGLSFGGFPAAVYSGGLGYAEAVRLCHDSALEQADYLAGQPEPSGCLFFYRLGRQAVDELVAEVRGTGQWIEIAADLGLDVHGVSASMSTLELVRQEVSRRGGAPIYTMDRPQHCRAIMPLRERLAERIYPPAGFRAPTVPMISDVDGSLVRTGAELSLTLLQGWTEPVYVRVAVEALLRQEVRRVYLVGPRTMFSRLLAEHFDVVVVSPESVLAGAPA